MTNRELFHATMSCDNGDKLLHMEQGFNIPYEQWLADGLPKYVARVGNAELTPGENLYDHYERSWIPFLPCQSVLHSSVSPGPGTTGAGTRPKLSAPVEPSGELGTLWEL